MFQFRQLQANYVELASARAQELAFNPYFPLPSALFIYLFIIESCTEYKQNAVNIMVQRSASSNI